MKIKSLTLRDAILKAAASSFLSHGFDNASMLEIAARTPCSKVTLYAYFTSKDNLFYEAIVQALEDQFHDLYGYLDDARTDPFEVLTAFGERFVALICADEVRALRRLVMTARGAGAADLQRKCFEEGPKVALAVCAGYFSKMQECGMLCVPNPALAGLQLRALLEAEWLDSLLFNQKPNKSAKRIRLSAERAVHAFLTIYKR